VGSDLSRARAHTGG